MSEKTEALPADADRQPTEEELKQQEQEAEEGFASGFAKVSGNKEEEPPKEEPDPKEEDDEPKEEEEDDDEPKPADDEPPADDPLKSIQEQLTAITNWQRNIGGQVGGLADQVKRMSATAKAAATSQGADSPDPDKVEAAIGDAEEWGKLKAEYPEWTEGFEKQMSVLEKRVLQKVPQVDTEALKTELRQETGKSVEDLEKVLPVYIKYPGWKKDINTQEFKAWLPAQPQEILALAESDDPEDAIQLLDKYEEHKAAKAAETNASAEKDRRHKKNQQRLDAATTPKGAGEPPQKGLSDEEAFERGYKKQAGR